MQLVKGSAIYIPAAPVADLLERADLSAAEKIVSKGYIMEAIVRGAIRFIQLDLDPWRYFASTLDQMCVDSGIQHAIVDEFASASEDIIEYIVCFESTLAEVLADNPNVVFTFKGNVLENLQRGFIKLTVTSLNESSGK